MSNIDIEDLKAEADAMGISYHPNISATKLEKRIADKQETPDEAEVQTKEQETNKGKKVVKPTPEQISNARVGNNELAETAQQRQQRLKRDASRLVHIQLTCMNPNKKAWDGEIFTVSNGVVGTYRRYVPFNADEGWYVENIIYKYLKDKECQIFGKAKKGQPPPSRLIKEFSIAVIPDLTPDELQELKIKQAQANNIG